MVWLHCGGAVPGGTVTQASHAADAFALGKIHKDIAMYMVGTLDDEETGDQAILKVGLRPR